MEFKSLSKDDALQLLEIIHESLACTTEAGLIGVMARLRGLVSYQASLSSIVRMRHGVAGELKVVNVDYPHAYLSELHKRDLIWKDPIVVENFKRYCLQFWADTFERIEFTPETHEIISLAEDFGFNQTAQGHGYGHGIRSRDGKIASFFCYHGLKRSTRVETILNLIIPHFHEALNRICSPDHEEIFQVTPREKEILEWLIHGKSTWDISHILQISERTVKFHVSNILRKLNASSRSHAVAIALEHGLVEME